jgi:hypothetical protein
LYQDLLRREHWPVNKVQQQLLLLCLQPTTMAPANPAAA